MERIDHERDRRRSRDRRAGTRAAEAAALATAIERDEIEVLFQPQYAAADDVLIGAEALARWRHPEQFIVGGEALFEIAERAGLTETLSLHVAGAALAEASAWPNDLRLSINVTAADLADGRFVERIAAAVADAGFAPGRLTLEITEQALVADLDRSAERLRSLAGLGIRIALDDFGAGFCNFGYLKRLPLHCLKLDRSMVEGIDEDRRDLAVLRGILSMARALGLEVIAEGIERDSQRLVVVGEGCTAWQGYLGSRPLVGSAFAEHAASRQSPGRDER